MSGSNLFGIFALSSLVSLVTWSAACTDKPASKTLTIDESLANLNLDATGTYDFTINDYAIEASNDSKVMLNALTDVRGRLYLPKKEGAGPFPVLVFLHGNHGTCGITNETTGVRSNQSSQFTSTGVCPEGWTESPSYAGYEYIAKNLASFGYATISLNANLGITAGPGTLIKERGKLVLKHLAMLTKWNREGAGSLFPDMDLRNKFVSA